VDNQKFGTEGVHVMAKKSQGAKSRAGTPGGKKGGGK